MLPEDQCSETRPPKCLLIRPTNRKSPIIRRSHPCHPEMWNHGDPDLRSLFASDKLRAMVYDDNTDLRRFKPQRSDIGQSGNRMSGARLGDQTTGVQRD